MSDVVDIIKALSELDDFWGEVWIIVMIAVFCLLLKIVNSACIRQVNEQMILYVKNALSRNETIEECVKELNSYKELLSNKKLNSDCFLSNEMIVHKAVCRLIATDAGEKASEWQRKLKRADKCFNLDDNQNKIIRDKNMKAFIIAWGMLFVVPLVYVLLDKAFMSAFYIILTLFFLLVMSLLVTVVGFITSYILENIIAQILIWRT